MLSKEDQKYAEAVGRYCAREDAKRRQREWLARQAEEADPMHDQQRAD